MYLNLDFTSPFLTINEEKNLLLPLNYMLDLRESKFDLVPSVEHATESIPGVDGEILYASKYSARVFDMVCYSKDNLSLQDKQTEQKLLRLYMDKLKTEPCPLFYQGNVYMVQYNNNVDQTNNGHYLKWTLPLKANDCYGYSQQVYSIQGNSSDTVTNSGNQRVGTEITFTGSVTNPYVVINGHKISYDGVIPQNTTVVIHTSKRTAVMTAYDGTKTNAFGGVSGLRNPVYLEPTISLSITGKVTERTNVISMSHPDNTVMRWREKNI